MDIITINGRQDEYQRTMKRYGIVVDDVFKGEPADTLFVITGETPSECGVMLDIGRSYILYTSKFDVSSPGSGDFRAENVTSRCTRTRPLDEAEINALKRIR